jgi:hypothetical protein
LRQRAPQRAAAAGLDAFGDESVELAVELDVDQVLELFAARADEGLDSLVDRAYGHAGESTTSNPRASYCVSTPDSP